jgi:hypothetical protein
MDERQLHTVAAGLLLEIFPRWSVASPTALAAASIAAGPHAVRPIIASVVSQSHDAAPAAFNKVAASLFRSALAGRFGLFPLPKLCILDGFVESYLRCVKTASSAAVSPNPLFEFVGHYVAYGPTYGLTCDVIKCHSRTLRRLTVPKFTERAAEALACAVAKCTVLEALDLTKTRFPFHSWAHLGSTLHTLSVPVPAVTFRMLADYMPALRVLCVYIYLSVEDDGFIDVVSRLESLQIHMDPWSSLTVLEWPLALPNLKEFVWKFGNDEDVLGAEILRRAPSLRSVSVPHFATLSAVREEGSLGRAFDVPPVPLLLRVRALTLTDVSEDGAALAQTLAAVPAVTSLTLHCASGNTLWRALDAAAKGPVEGGLSSRVRRLQLRTDRDGYDVETRRQLADRAVRLFPRVRLALCENIMTHGCGDESSTMCIFPLD